MAQSEVSFDATGPTFVAFETTGSSLPAYGVGVYGIENGVRGVAGTKIINELAANGGSSGVTRDLVQTGVGVQGVGDSAGRSRGQRGHRCPRQRRRRGVR